ncbi:MAG: IS66 family transposase [Rhodothermaceae bacterium]|nr:IS66 family transposase [Rhodothermaceae bacterium]MYE63444.1 IS66 family transposase [Rhodothermaceae bacterium]MYJ20190.1 IS66 family transposase [Rhodothermaceae bacterium]
MERIHDMLGPDISVQRLLRVLLGEESAEYVWGLVAELGETGERAVMPLIEEIVRARAEILECNDVILHLRRQLFGSKRERYIDPNQGELFPGQGTVIELRQAEEPAAPERTRKKPKPRFLFTDERIRDLPTEVIEIDPAGDLSHLKKIGAQEHLVLDYRRARLRVLKYVRNQYVDPTDATAGVLTGSLPDGVQGKRTATPELMAHVVVNKYVDHVPLDRTQKQFSRLGAPVPKSTLADYCAHVANDLSPLYDLQREAVLAGGYIQVDETRVPVRDRDKSKVAGKHHLGYFWGYSDPVSKLVFFDDQPGRSRAGPLAILAGYQGHLQTDAYNVYDIFGQRDGILHFNCVAHCRRKFEKAKSSKSKRVGALVAHVLSLFRKVYAIERDLRTHGASYAKRKQVRQRKSAPIFAEIKTVLEANSTAGSEAWRGAVYDALVRWDKLTRFLNHGEVEIDNNLIENRVRPIALGRKNYLFAGSHAAAQRTAILYSLLNTCALHGVNPMEWLVDVLKRIPTTATEDLSMLLPHHWNVARSLDKAA